MGRGEPQDGTGEAADLRPDRLLAALRASDEVAATVLEADPAAGRVVRAPGRVNLIGEHTDYNEGFVLPAAIGLETRIALVPTDDRRVEITLLATGERQGFDLDGIGRAHGGWIDYVAGTAWALADADLPTRGFRGVLASTLPMSAGLSSSAALELAAAWALLDPPELAAHVVDGMTLAQLAQRAENVYVGVQCGLMDQFASSLGKEDAAMLLDCRTLEHRPVALNLRDHALVVCDSGSPRRLEASDYNTRRAQCEAAAAAIGAHEPDVRSLRDVDLPMLQRHADRLDPVAVRRSEHVIRENARVLDAVAAFEAGDLETVGRLFAESHASLRDLFEVSSPELDALVEVARSVPGTLAARMTGAGFGGSTINIVRRDALDSFRETVKHEYRARTSLIPSVLSVRPAAGAGVVQA
jgi:galactokinase